MTKPNPTHLEIPRKLKIGGRAYKVLYPYTFEGTTSPLYGLHDAVGQTIKLAKKDEYGANRNKESIYHTFLHEVIHAVDNVFNGGRLTAWEKGEETIDSIAEGIMQLIVSGDIGRIK